MKENSKEEKKNKEKRNRCAKCRHLIKLLIDVLLENACNTNIHDNLTGGKQWTTGYDTGNVAYFFLVLYL